MADCRAGTVSESRPAQVDKMAPVSCLVSLFLVAPVLCPLSWILIPVSSVLCPLFYVLSSWCPQPCVLSSWCPQFWLLGSARPLLSNVSHGQSIYKTMMTKTPLSSVLCPLSSVLAILSSPQCPMSRRWKRWRWRNSSVLCKIRFCRFKCSPSNGALNWTALHYNGKLCSSLHFLHCTSLHYFALHCTTLHCTSLHFIAVICTALHCTSLHCTVQHNIAHLVYCNKLHVHCTVLHCTAMHLHCTLLHYSAWIHQCSLSYCNWFVWKRLWKMRGSEGAVLRGQFSTLPEW